MNYLLDTNVISALSPTRQNVDERLREWVRSNSDHICLTMISIAEIQHAIVQMERTGAGSKSARLSLWLAVLEHPYAARILPFDIRAAHQAGKLLDKARAFDPGFADIAIAAIA